MAITISLGNPGSGKTLMSVRDMILNRNNRKTYTNILPLKPKLTPNIIPIKPDMIIKNKIVGHNRKNEAVYKLELNKDFWVNINEPINVVLDEVHSILNSRRSMSKVNQIVTDWMALIRRVLGSSSTGYGELTLISQLHNRIDVIARDMATLIKYHLCHYTKQCIDCKLVWNEHSDFPEPIFVCPRCKNSRIRIVSYLFEVWHFANMEKYLMWKDQKLNTFHKHYLIRNAEQYFKYYNTLQWDNLFSEFY